MPNTSSSKLTVAGTVQAADSRYVALLLKSMPIERLRQLVAEIESELAGAEH